MTSRQFTIGGDLTVTVSKRPSCRSIRLTIAGNNQVKVSIPKWLPYSSAVNFAQSKIDWIRQSMPPSVVFNENRPIGKNHRLVFKSTNSQKITTRLTDLEATVFYPKELTTTDEAVQAAARRVTKKALHVQAERLLPQRLDQLAKKHSYSYSQVQIKGLKSRWGSCDAHQKISLNLYLMELPWEIIDYVILHELNHTLVMQHGPKFWQSLETKLPNYRALKDTLKSYPTLI